jgi:hypothetical protein
MPGGSKVPSGQAEWRQKRAVASWSPGIWMSGSLSSSSGWAEALKAATLPLVARLSKSMISAKAVGDLTALASAAPGS